MTYVKPTSADLLERNTKRRNWQSALVVVLGAAIIGAMATLMYVVFAHM